MLFMSSSVASFLGLLFYILSIIIHVLVIKRIIPFTWVNGGRSESYKVQKVTSIRSIPVLIVGILFIEMGFLFPSFRTTLVFCIIAFFLTAFWLLGFVMQLLGTKFERFVMSWVLLLGILSHLQLALIYIYQ